MGPWIIGYGTFLLGLFTICTMTFGLSATVLGFIMTFVVCSLATFLFWWQDEQQWGKSHYMDQESTPVVPSSLSSTVTNELNISQYISQQECFSINDNDFDLLETYTQDLTQRVEAVYPLVDREHVHKIVWTVMVELFCKRLAPSPSITPASVIAAKMVRAA